MNNDNFGGIDVNQLRQNSDANKGFDIPDLDKYRQDAEARREVQRRTDEMAKTLTAEEEYARKMEIAKMQKELDASGRRLQRKKVIRRRRTIIAVAIIATAIAAGIVITKVVPSIINNFPTATQETTQHEMTLDELKATLDAGYTEVQINGHWYGTKDAIESMEQGVPLNESLSIDQKTQDNIDDNKIR